MGVVFDRINRRTSSVVTDLISVTSVAALPIIDLVSGLNLGWFALFGIITSIGSVPAMFARQKFRPANTPHRNIGGEHRVAGPSFDSSSAHAIDAPTPRHLFTCALISSPPVS